ncbi:hypothetical protein [Chitinophaga sp. sic0106]|uniref:hypothetical protein n=1 Tax=Chitinophaga sp. sic0106 TaxID=2854785 RepID=UPI001C451FD4|nr:hypothetical protein [Chitinophaga sp. sic0106]MBV7533720.1 hypothetical protein [Chitinophaga sp. sic0106]
MKKAELNSLMDILDGIKKIDSMILLHESLDDSTFMISQYQSKKSKLIDQFIDELLSSHIQTEQRVSLIQQVIVKYYPALSKGETHYDDEEIEQLSRAI